MIRVCVSMLIRHKLAGGRVIICIHICECKLRYTNVYISHVMNLYKVLYFPWTHTDPLPAQYTRVYRTCTFANYPDFNIWMLRYSITLISEYMYISAEYG